MNSCLDAYSTSFDAFTPMLNYHEQQDAQTEWRSCRVNSLTVVPLDVHSPLTMSSFSTKTSSEAVEDTKQNLGLAMGLYDGYYPIRDSPPCGETTPTTTWLFRSWNGTRPRKT